MDFWGVAFLGGLVGSVFMDVVEAFMANRGIYSGVTGSHIGRWAHGLIRGKVYYSDIEKTEPVRNELKIAFIFHYLIGGGVVALGYPVMLSFVDLISSPFHLPWAIFYGLLTCAFPWFILMPSIGKGVAGRKMPIQAKPIIAPIISHLAYGLGIGVTISAYGWIMA